MTLRPKVMGKARRILEGCEHGQCDKPATTSEAPLSFLDICEAIQGTLLKMCDELQMAAARIDFYINEARRMKKEKKNEQSKGS